MSRHDYMQPEDMADEWAEELERGMTDTDNTAQRLADFIRAEGDKIVMDAPRQGQYREAETELHRLARVEAENERFRALPEGKEISAVYRELDKKEAELAEARKRIAELGEGQQLLQDRSQKLRRECDRYRDALEEYGIEVPE